ncbi:hypothetical protein FISHEDRAFT_78744 [Fistulina hepatica ATCC 64428]|uniref:Uncharacterized protein n=1 Tax=Fistulina hepatica ATCC 64428 TaxID=1128425 RepID=A0A0D7A2R2_9AGAR|nr:hypothetical protein FISHEDRAFT_78744 [Fistulina hepatica ATCC 64428]
MRFAFLLCMAAVSLAVASPNTGSTEHESAHSSSAPHTISRTFTYTLVSPEKECTRTTDCGKLNAMPRAYCYRPQHRCYESSQKNSEIKEGPESSSPSSSSSSASSPSSGSSSSSGTTPTKKGWFGGMFSGSKSSH